MSVRTIIEINHDFARDIERDNTHFVRLLSYALGSGSDEAWERLRRYGIRRAVECHHSEPRKVVAHGQEYPLG